MVQGVAVRAGPACVVVVAWSVERSAENCPAIKVLHFVGGTDTEEKKNGLRK